MKNLDDSSNLIHSLDSPVEKIGVSYPIFIVLIIAVVVAGVLGGYMISKVGKTSSSSTTSSSPAKQVAGIVDRKTFKDSAEGILKDGGIDGEGNFHLERPGGVSQNVYLTSSTVDLSQFIGKKVRVWGATFQGQTAGWLMDVGTVETL